MDKADQLEAGKIASPRCPMRSLAEQGSRELRPRHGKLTVRLETAIVNVLCVCRTDNRGGSTTGHRGRVGASGLTSLVPFWLAG